jgi:hypothetical protein
VKPTTRVLPELYPLCIALLTDYHHDRIKGATKRVVVHSRVSLNSYNINAQVTSNLKRVVKRKILILNGVVYTGVCLCLRKEER